MVIDVVVVLYGVAFLLIFLPGVYLAWRQKKSNGSANYRARQIVTPLGALFLLIGGCWASHEAGKNADFELRRHLISETIAVAHTINPIRVGALRFDNEDINNPVFLRLRSQLRAYAQATSLAYIFSVARRDDAYVFGPESIADAHPLASPPGTRYELPPKELEAVFTNREALTVGPYTDEFGTFVSAFVPVIDPASTMVVLALGADIAADSWETAIMRARIQPLLFSLALLAVLAIGNAALSRRQSFPIKKQRRWRFIEAALCAVTGTAITLAVASLTHDAAKRGRYDSFSSLARAHAGAVTESMHDMRMRLDSLASFFESSEIVDAEEFASFTEVLARDGLSQSWEWAYAIPASSRETFEAKAGKQGLTDFFVWERNEKREKMPVKERDIYYPVLHVAPVHGNESVYGYDVGSEPVRHKALKESVDTGLATGTEPIILVQEPGMQQGMLAFRPVFKDNMLHGFALVTFRFRPMLHRAVTRAGHQTSGIAVEMFQLQENAPPLFLASSSSSHYPGYLCDRHQRLNALCIHVPLFVFGNTYVLAAHPESEWLSAHPLWVGWATALAGLVITAILTAFIVSLSNRRAFLEEEVVQRTSALQLSETLLFNERAKLKRILDNMPIGIYMVTRDYEIRYMNPALQKVSLSVEGEKCYERFYGQDKPCDWCVNDKVFQGESARWECTFPGNGRIYEVYDTPITDTDGVPCKLSIFHDITDIKEAQEALRISEARTAATLRSIGDGVISTDMTGKIMGMNAAAERLTGWPADEAEGRPISEVFHIIDGTTKENAVNPVWAVLKEGDPAPAADPIVLAARDGAERYIADSYAPIRTLSDEIIGAVLVFRDITREYAMQRELHENEIRMNAVISAAQDGIIMLNAAGDISMWNDASTRIFGYERGEVMGKNLHLLLAPKRYHDDYRRAFATFQKAGTGDAIGHITELTALRKNGREFPIELSLSAVRLGGEWHAVGIVRDITARKRVEQEMLDMNRQMEEAIELANQMAANAEMANAAKSAFLANVSHEIRTPMNGIIGMTALLLDTELAEPQRRCAEIIRDSSESLLSMINDILDFSKIEAGKLEIESIDFDLHSLMDDFATLLGVRAQSKGLELVCAADPDVPVMLRGDPGRLRQILTNLTDNAVKFTHEGEVVVRVARVSENESGVLLRFTVRDTGIGIPENKKEMLFQSFTQVDPSTTRKYGGTGLGLAITKQLVELMNGKIGVNSAENEGSEFWFTVRLPAGRQAPHEPPASTDLRGARALVVDDNAANRQMLCAQLEAHGITADEASNGVVALQMLHEARDAGQAYNLAILDMLMPGMDGEALGRAIHSDERLKNTPLVMMTAIGRRGDARRFEDIGFSAYLIKPVRQTDLLDCLSVTLAAHGGTEKPRRRPIVTRHSVRELRKYHARILLAEDNVVNQQVAQGMLQKAGVSVDVVKNGREALDALRKNTYDMALMDVQMPEMDGLEAARRFRASARGRTNPNIPVIAMTAHVMQEDRDKCVAAGMNDYIAKPLEAEALIAIIRKWLPEKKKVHDYSRVITSDEKEETETKMETPDTTLFDKPGLMARLMDDEALARALIATFLEDMPRQIGTLKTSFESENIDEATRQAHTIKGAAANTGAVALSRMAADLEQAGKQKDTGEMMRLISELDHLLDMTQQAMEKL